MSLHAEATGDGPDLVLLHGWGLHGGVWDEVVPRLARRFRVHAVDLPGHGRSSSHVADTFESAVDLVASVVPAGAHVCAWSMGGLLAQRLTARDPDHISRLVLVGTTPCFVARAGWDDAMRPETLAAFGHGLARDRDATLASFVRLNALNGARGREATRAFTARLAEHGPPSPEGLAASLGWLREQDLRGAAPHIAAPTLVIHGARDALAPVAAGRWLAQAIPGARLLEIEDAAHLPFFTHCERFADAVEAHLG